MTQDQRLEYLIHYLLAEREEYRDVALPVGPAEKRRLLRALVNVRPSRTAGPDVYTRCRTPICRRNCAAKG